MTPASALKSTVDDILGKPGVAFRISMPLVLVTVVLFVLVVTTLNAFEDTLVVPSEQGLTFWLVGLLAVVFGVFALVVCWTWTAVAWHRHVILGEQPGTLLPPWPGGRLLGYVGRSILVFIVVAVISIGPLILASAIAPTSTSDDPMDGTMRSYEFGGMPPDFSPLSLVVWVVLAALIWGVSLRVGLILPAGAIDRPKTLGETWGATKGRFLNLFAPLGLVIAVVFAVLDLTTSVFSFGGVAELASVWLQSMIGIGILTRLHIGFFGSAPADPALPDASAGVV